MDRRALGIALPAVGIYAMLVKAKDIGSALLVIVGAALAMITVQGRRRGQEATRSEAATLRILIGLALTKLGDEVALRNYELLAASRDDEDEAFDTALRHRRHR